MLYKTVKTLAPVVEPVTLAEAKEQLRIEASFLLDDAYISALISAARDRAENYCNRFFTEAQATIVYYEGFPSVFRLPYPDLISVDAISYVDFENQEQTIIGYTFDSETQIITPTDDWPTNAKTIKVDISTGTPVEFEGVKQAILMWIADLYELRVENVVGGSLSMNKAVEMMLYPYRVELGI